MSANLMYGLHAVRGLLQRSPLRLRRLSIDARRNDARLQEVLKLAAEHGVLIERLDAKQLQQRVGEVVHQGVVAEIEPLKPWTEDDLLSALTEPRNSKALVLVLDGVQDPHNLGACMRTADACGALAVVVPKDRAAGLSPAARKVAAGAADSLPLVTVTNLARSLKLLKEAGLWIAGADMAGTQAVWEADLSGPMALVMGGEGDGLRDLTQRNCDILLHLPQRGSVESLNVSVACGMLLYEAVRQRHAPVSKGR